MTYEGSGAPPAELGFGVVCKADWLFDIAIRSNSCTLKRKDDYPPKKAQSLYGRPDVEYYMPEPHAENEEEFAVLGFGTSYPAYIVLTDDCAIEKCRGRKGWKPTDQVTLAPLGFPAKGDPKDLALISTLNRFPLPKDRHFATDYVVSLARAFQVDSRHIWTDARQLQPGFELLRRLDDETKDGLLQRWAAHTSRQGPLIGADNARKLFDIISALADTRSAEGIADQMVDLADAIWVYENGPLEAISGVHEEWHKTSQPPDLGGVTGDLKDRLEIVEMAVSQLIDALKALRGES